MSDINLMNLSHLLLLVEHVIEALTTVESKVCLNVTSEMSFNYLLILILLHWLFCVINWQILSQHSQKILLGT